MFVPRIPEAKIEQDENTTIPRICFADTIQNCIRAVNGYPRDEVNYIRVYELEVEPNDSDLISWEELYMNGYVNDAELTHEYWYLKPVKMKSRLYKISGIRRGCDGWDGKMQLVAKIFPKNEFWFWYA